MGVGGDSLGEGIISNINCCCLKQHIVWKKTDQEQLGTAKILLHVYLWKYACIRQYVVRTCTEITFVRKWYNWTLTYFMKATKTFIFKSGPVVCWKGKAQKDTTPGNQVHFYILKLIAAGTTLGISMGTIVFLAIYKKTRCLLPLNWPAGHPETSAGIFRSCGWENRMCLYAFTWWFAVARQWLINQFGS